MYVKKLSRKRYNSKKQRKSKSKSKRTTRRRRSSKRGGAEPTECKSAKITAQDLIRTYNNNSTFTFGSNPIDKEQVKTKLQTLFDGCKFNLSSNKILSQKINKILGNTTTTTANPDNVDQNLPAWKKYGFSDEASFNKWQEQDDTWEFPHENEFMNKSKKNSLNRSFRLKN